MTIYIRLCLHVIFLRLCLVCEFSSPVPGCDDLECKLGQDGWQYATDFYKKSARWKVAGRSLEQDLFLGIGCAASSMEPPFRTCMIMYVYIYIYSIYLYCSCIVIHIYIYAYICIWIYIYTHTYIFAWICFFIYAFIYVYFIWVNIYTDMHITFSLGPPRRRPRLACAARGSGDVLMCPGAALFVFSTAGFT